MLIPNCSRPYARHRGTCISVTIRYVKGLNSCGTQELTWMNSLMDSRYALSAGNFIEATPAGKRPGLPLASQRQA